MKKDSGFSRREFIKATSLAALGTNVAGGLAGATSAHAGTTQTSKAQVSDGPYNILMIVTDQERHMEHGDIPAGALSSRTTRLDRVCARLHVQLFIQGSIFRIMACLTTQIFLGLAACPPK